MPQGGPLSWLLANVMLDDLDKLLESREMWFAPCADDFSICVKSSSSGYRVMRWVKKYLSRRLKLVKTNKPFFRLTFKGKKIRWNDQALSDVKHNIRRLTKRSWGISMYRRYRAFRLYIQGFLTTTSSEYKSRYVSEKQTF